MTGFMAKADLEVSPTLGPGLSFTKLHGENARPMRDVFQNNEAARQIVERDLGIHITEPFAGLLLVDLEKEAITGAVIFNHYKPDHSDVEFTCVLRKPDVGMRMARRVAWYAFKVLDCRRCTAVTKRSNTKAQTALETLGFRVEGYLREYFGEEDGIIYGLLRSEQRLVRGIR